MTERLTDEQLAAIRERAKLVVTAREREAEANRHMVENMSSLSAVQTFHALQDIRMEAEEDLKYHADEDIPALLAHIDALEAENAKLRRRRKVIGLEQVDLADFDVLYDPYGDDEA